MKIAARRLARAHRQLRPRRPARSGAGRVRAPPAALPVVRRGGPRPARDRGQNGDGQALSQPPPGMEQRVLAAAYRTRQLPPLPGHRAGGRPDHRRAQVARLFAGRPGRVPRRVAAFAAAASVAAAVALGITQVVHSAPARVDAGERRRDHPGRHRARRAHRDPEDERGRKRHRGRLRRPAGSRRHHDRAGIPARRAGLPGVGDKPVRRALGGPDGPARAPCWLRRWCPATGSG